MSLIMGSTICLSVLPEIEHRPLARRMSAPGLTSEAQLRYILQWFEEFSELQREDFLPILAAACGGKPDQLAAALATISCHDKPVSLFQCRIKLFNEWYPTWSDEEQDRLIKRVSEIDSDFGNKFQDIMKNGFKVNGELNGVNDIGSLDDENNDEVENISNQETVNDEENREDVMHDNNIPFEIAAAS